MKPTEPHHLSKLVLDRYRTGELSPEEASDVEARLDDRGRRHLEAVAEARPPALDLAALRARAAALPDGPPPTLHGVVDEAEVDPSVDDSEASETVVLELLPRRRPRVFSLAISAVMVAAAAVIAVIGLSTDPIPGPGQPDTVIFRGSPLAVYVAQGAQLHPYDGRTPVGAGDVLGFRVRADGHNGLSLLSVDGRGTVSVFFPARGTTPEPLDGTGMVELSGTVMLDDAPGPEVFVALFDQPADVAFKLVQDTYAAGGHDAVRQLAEDRTDVATAEVMRR